MKFSYYTRKIKDIHFRDILSFFPMLVAASVAVFFKKRNKNVWLICEEPAEARDNGFWFYRYVRQQHPSQQCVYAIKHNGVDYAKVCHLGPIVEYGSLQHWILYFTCQFNISSQKGGKPNAAVCAFLELNNLSKTRNVFLQHGITINDAKWLYADRSSFDLFITGTRPETEFIKKTFGYPEKSIQYTGFARFDNLHNHQEKENRILIMPSWRAWFREKSAQVDVNDSVFAQSDYLRYWKSLISADRIKEYITRQGLEIIFYPHRNMQPYIDSFKSVTSGVVIASSEQYDIQELLKSSRMLITDYSSVFFDMVYMRKPVVFFQFDEEKFRAQQYQKGYFDYHNSAFGPFCKTVNQVLNQMDYYIQRSFDVSSEYLLEHRKTFELYDTNNSQRIYDLLKKSAEKGE